MCADEKKTGRNEPAVFIHFEPTRNELRRCWYEMDRAGVLATADEAVRSLSGWMNYYAPALGEPQALELCPVVIEVEGRYPAVIELSDWDPARRMAQVHFTAHALYRPKSVFCAARLALGLILRSNEVRVLRAVWEPQNRRAQRMAEALGFVVFPGEIGGCVYSFATTETLATGARHEQRSKKTGRTTARGRTGDPGKRRGAGGR
jgi:RimJ/RimL family protein N-acetyltransferase